MLQDIPESLIEKARKMLREDNEANKRPPDLPIGENEKPPEQASPEDKEKEDPKRKGEPIIFNPEIRPDVYTEPYKVQPTT